MSQITIKKNGRFEAVLYNNGQKERIGIAESLSSYGRSRAKEVLSELDKNAQVLWAENPGDIPGTIEALINTFLVFYAFADKRPDGSLKKVNTDIMLDSDAVEFLKGMFDHYNQPFPKINAKLRRFPKVRGYGTDNKDIVTFSGGKDSTFIALETGAIPIHIGKINKGTQTRELETIIKMTPYLPEDPLVIPLQNSLNPGSGTSRYEMRNALIYTLLLPVCHRFGTRTIYSGSYDESKWYATIPESVEKLNNLFRTKSIKTNIKIIDYMSEEELIAKFTRKYPDAFRITSPCVMTDIRHHQYRNWFSSKFPGFPLVEGACGVCGKDVQLNMAQLIHDPKILSLPYKVRKDVADYCLKRSDAKGVSDFIEPELVEKIKKKYS